MDGLNTERNNSVIDTSLTELSFIFFFILLMIAAWQINEFSEELSLKESVQKELKEKNTQLTEQAAKLKQNLISLQDTFDELTLAQWQNKETVLELAKQRLENANNTQLIESLKAQIEEQQIASFGNTLELQQIVAELGSTKELKEKIDEHQQIEKLFAEYAQETKLAENRQLPHLVDSFLQQSMDLKGQNINLRNKLAKEKNGLDHPPCWADPKTGAIEYVFNARIREKSIVFTPAWPKHREKQAKANPNINKVLGTYSNRDKLWLNSGDLFNESVQQNCRHFVRVIDNASSKKSFKYYLSAVENHFYKYLSARS